MISKGRREMEKERREKTGGKKVYSGTDNVTLRAQRREDEMQLGSGSKRRKSSPFQGFVTRVHSIGSKKNCKLK
jgi:hypothetical protein